MMIRCTNNGNWAVPGGAIDLGESVAQAAVRETLEKSGIECAITGIAGIYSDPTMATIQGNLAAAEAAAEQRSENEARDWAAVEQAGIDEPVNHAETQAEPEAAADLDRAEVNDADIEI
jgi:ADP-ribose pyrophosphatase YjhB (NUDIX family)